MSSVVRYKGAIYRESFLGLGPKHKRCQNGTHWNDVAKSCQELDHDLLTLSTAAHSKTRDLEHTRGLPGREKEHLHKVNQAALDHIVAGLEAQSRGFNELHQEHEEHKKKLIDEAVKLRKRLVKGTK